MVFGGEGVSAGLGHNGGPSVAPGAGWRAHCWSRARADLLPTLPLEVVRLRVRRAAEIGLDYRTYATVRATTGHDIVAFLFSSNALRLFREGQALEAARAEALARQRGVAQRLAQQPPLTPEAALSVLAGQGLAFEGAAPAPGLLGWGALSRAVREMAGARPADRVLMVGDTGLERDWAAAGRLAGYLPAERFFAGAVPA
ncbi:hypothetical protein V8J36_11240 [Frigidibacter sp. MR17.14]|uniref:hypothetical protein n=1 Tax=Frigidibacter sp. MR17.14 TaxID=3126509 RepID=UPI003012D927